MPGMPRAPSAVETGAAAGIEFAQTRTVRNRIVLPAAITHHDVADGEIRIARGDDLADRPAHHGGADLDWLGVGFRRTHAAPHVGIEREPARAHEHFAIAGLRHRPLPQGEIIEARRLTKNL